jgi:hypothetical protein
MNIFIRKKQQEIDAVNYEKDQDLLLAAKVEKQAVSREITLMFQG